MMDKSGIKHKDVGVELTQAEWISEESHEIVSGSSFPGSPVERQLFYRNDLHQWYIYNGTGWILLSGINWNDIVNKPASPSLEEMATEHEEDGRHGTKVQQMLLPLNATTNYSVYQIALGTYSDNLYFADQRFTVTLTPAPDTGDESRLFNGNPNSYPRWKTDWATQKPVVLTIDYGSHYHWDTWAAILVDFNYARYCTDILVEVYRETSNGAGDWSWRECKHITDNTNSMLIMTDFNPDIVYSQQVRITFSGDLNHTDDFRISAVAAYIPTEPEGFALMKTGGIVYGDLEMASGNYFLIPKHTPASAGASGKKGAICHDSNYIYVCIANNTWRRVAISSW